MVFGAGADLRARHRLSDHAGSMQILVYGRELVASQMGNTDKLPDLSVAQNSLSLTQSKFNPYPMPAPTSHIRVEAGPGPASYCIA